TEAKTTVVCPAAALNTAADRGPGRNLAATRRRTPLPKPDPVSLPVRGAAGMPEKSRGPRIAVHKRPRLGQGPDPVRGSRIFKKLAQGMADPSVLAPVRGGGGRGI